MWKVVKTTLKLFGCCKMATTANTKQYGRWKVTVTTCIEPRVIRKVTVTNLEPFGGEKGHYKQGTIWHVEGGNDQKYGTNRQVKNMTISLQPTYNAEWANQRRVASRRGRSSIPNIKPAQHGGVIRQFRLRQAERILGALESCRVHTNNSSSRFPLRHAKFLLAPLCHFSTLPDTLTPWQIIAGSKLPHSDVTASLFIRGNYCAETDI